MVQRLHVLGFQSKGNDYFFDRILDSKLWGVIQQYSQRKPTLVFTSSRASTVSSASKLLESCSQNGSSYVSNDQQKERLFKAAGKVNNDPQLSACIMSGIGYHHAGMAPENRTLVESLFATGSDIMVVIATSTLAVGVNLPAYLVVIRSTNFHTKDGTEEISPLQIRQMIGRAGRPQFGDLSAAAVIMTHQHKVSTYESILECDAPVTESNLHKHLFDTLLAEIELGSIHSITEAFTYLQHTFLAVRVHQNPNHYRVNSNPTPSSLPQPNQNQTSAPLPPNAASASLSVRYQDPQTLFHPLLRSMCMSALALLCKFECIELDKQSLAATTTELGRTASRYFVSFASLQSIIEAFSKDNFDDSRGDISTHRLLEILSQSPEFSGMLVRRAEKKELREISAQVRFPLKAGRINLAEKLFVLLQATLLHKPRAPAKSSPTFLNASLNVEAESCAKTAISLLHCLIQFFIDREWFFSLHKAILLLKSFRRRTWIRDGSLTMQIPIITLDMAETLKKSGYGTLLDLMRLTPEPLAQILKSTPQFAQNVMNRLLKLPSYGLSIQVSVEAPALQSQRNNVSSSSTHNHPQRVIKFAIHPMSEANVTSQERAERRFLVLGHGSRILHCRQLSLPAQAKGPFRLQFPLPSDESITDLDLYFVSDEWIGFDVVGTVSLQTREIQQLMPQNEYQDPYDDVASQSNAKKRKRPTLKSSSATSTRTSSETDSPVVCHHKCKNKFTCKHQCCRRHPDVCASGNIQINIGDASAARLATPSASQVTHSGPRATKSSSIDHTPSKDAPQKSSANVIPTTSQHPAPSHPTSTQYFSRTSIFNTPSSSKASVVVPKSVSPPKIANSASSLTPRSVSPMPTVVMPPQDSETSSTASPIPGPIVVTHPGNRTSFLPFVEASPTRSPPAKSIASNYQIQKSAKSRFAPPKLLPGSKHPSNIGVTSHASNADERTLQPSLPYQDNSDDSTTSSRARMISRKSILSSSSPHPLGPPTPVKPSIHHKIPMGASKSSAGWQSLLNWDLDQAWRPEP